MTNPKHIVHVIHRFDTGGLENGLVNIINNLAEDKYHHTVVTMKGHNPDFVKRVTTNNLSLIDLNKQEGNDFGVYKRFYRVLKEIKPDVLHTRNTGTLEMQVVGWLCRVPYQIHGEHGWDVNDMHGSNKKYRLLRRLIRPFIDRYVALSIEARDYLKNIIGVSSRRIAHICNGVNTQRFQPDNPPAEDFPAHFKQENCLVFGTVGRLAEVKNQIYLMEAFIALHQRVSEGRLQLRLVIAGDGILMPKLKEMAKEAQIEQNVWFAGNRADIPQIMAGMDVFVLPSLAEGISNTILEAMASGLPVIATDVGGTPDLIMPALKQSHLVKVGNVQGLTELMANYVDNDSLLKDNSVAVRQHCEQHFSIETMVNKYHRLYQEVDD